MKFLFLHFISKSNEPVEHFVQTGKRLNVYFKGGQPVSELLNSSNTVIKTH